MKRLSAILGLILMLFMPLTMKAQSGTNRFEAGKGTFLLDGKPFVIKAAELHYPRIPRPYWEHRIQLCKALGMNTICLYVFWNAHETQPGTFNFEGQNDLAAFCELCRDNDMYVILRPGPYVCAEWEMGGLPWWLLKKKDIRLREDDPYFMECVAIFEEAVANQVKHLTIQNGGPIIMVQVENEYGSYGINKEYVSQVRDIVRKNFGDVTLFQCDWASNFTNNGLDDLVWTMNFGTGADIDQQFERLKQLRPDSPLMCSEFWSGWFDKWGANHETRPASDMIAGIDEMLSKGISFSLYMTHGGTNWGHWAGANSPGFAPDVTSYDYDAPISESGQTTPKYWELRKTLAKYMDGKKQAKVPAAIKPIAISAFKLTEMAPLFDNLPLAKKDKDIKTMEEYDQGFGSILYRTILPEMKGRSVLTMDAHDYTQVYIDGKLIGKIDRRLGEKQITLPPCRKGARLDILVEAMGRINFGRAIKDFKGIVGNVTLTIDMQGYPFECNLKNWEVFNIEDKLETYQSMKFKPIESLTDEQGQRIPGVYRGTFRVNKPGDTFLNFETWGKGLVYVNGHAMGRIWEIGPQQTLYIPGCWLKKGDNEILVFDIVGPKEVKCEGLRTPMIDNLQVAKTIKHDDPSVLDGMDYNEAKLVAEGRFASGNGWQDVKFSHSVKARYFCLLGLNAHDDKETAAMAELYLLDENGERISRESWKVLYADSEDTSSKNCTADKVFDLQESTYWKTEWGKAYPHYFIIDLGEECIIGGAQYLPRMESQAPGSIKDYKMLVK